MIIIILIFYWYKMNKYKSCFQLISSTDRFYTNPIWIEK